jgi:hypothetical protein
MSLLTLIQKVSLRVGVPKPSSAVGSNIAAVYQMIELANEEGEELAKQYQWQALTQEATFSTVATESQGSILTIAGADFNYIVNNTIWNRTLRRPVFGPLSTQQWQQLKAQNFVGPWNQYRLRGNNVLFIPIPAATQTCAFEWFSKNWCQSAGSTGQTAWAADTDIGILDEDLMRLGLMWRWKAAKGLDYAQDFDNYKLAVSAASSRDGSKPTLSLSGDPTGFQPGIIVPTGSWNVP